jgi:PAS domain S-box-containing protein
MAPTMAAMVLLTTSAWLSYRTLQDVRATYRLGEQVRAENSAADTVLSTLKDAETGQRGFLLTGEADFLEPYLAARARVATDLARLEEDPIAAAGQAGHIAALRSLAATKLAELDLMVAMQRSGQADAALARVRTRRGKQLMDAIRQEVQAFRSFNYDILARAQQASGATRRWAGPIVTAALASLLLGVMAQQWRFRNRAEAAARAEQERLSQGFGITQSLLRETDGRITYWGPGMEALYGYSEAMAVGRIGHELLRTRFPVPLPQIEAELAARGDWSGELIHRCRDGSTKTVMSRWVLQSDSAGTRRSVLEMNFDITALRQAEAQLRIALDAAGLGAFVWEAGSTREVFGVPREAIPSYALWHDLVQPEDLPETEAQIARLLDPNDPVKEASSTYRVRHPDGSVRWVVACRRAETVEDPAMPGGRAVTRLIGTLCDITEAKQLSLERERIGTLLRNIVETAPGPIYAKDTEGRYILANAGTLAVLCHAWEAVEGRTDLDLLPDPAQARAIMENDRHVMETGQAQASEELVGGSNGNARVWLSTKTPLRAADGRITGLVGISVEITERKRAEMRRELMIHELNHRVKNTLATVLAVAAETLQGAEPAMRAALNGRLMALAGVHDLLTRESWHSAELGEVVAAALAPFGGGETRRFQVSGPHILLLPRAAVALSMGLHELATNATKYGALHVPTGHVSLNWSIVPAQQRQFCMTWAEHGGPPVTRPCRRSFGSSMIEGVLSCDLGGTVALYFEASGVRCEIVAPFDEIAAPADDFGLPSVGRILAKDEIR